MAKSILMFALLFATVMASNLEPFMTIDGPTGADTSDMKLTLGYISEASVGFNG